jgi:hypothetical protein
MNVFKRCSCGHPFARGEWDLLSLGGYIEGAHGVLIELRNCSSCGSTMAVGARWSATRGRLVSLFET